LHSPITPLRLRVTNASSESLFPSSCSTNLRDIEVSHLPGQNRDLPHSSQKSEIVGGQSTSASPPYWNFYCHSSTQYVTYLFYFLYNNAVSTSKLIGLQGKVTKDGVFISELIDFEMGVIYWNIWK
jgi:hypothetical protein